MKRITCVLLLTALALGIALAPSIGLSEDDSTTLLARALYTLGHGESYETLLALGSVIMNRVDSPWFPDTVEEVINQPHQFAYGSRYDERTLKAAREVIEGKRTVKSYVVYYSALDATAKRDIASAVAVIGNYGFYQDKA